MTAATGRGLARPGFAGSACVREARRADPRRPTCRLFGRVYCFARNFGSGMRTLGSSPGGSSS